MTNAISGHAGRDGADRVAAGEEPAPVGVERFEEQQARVEGEQRDDRVAGVGIVAHRQHGSSFRDGRERDRVADDDPVQTDHADRDHAA
jgi:hypothetical protein